MWVIKAIGLFLTAAAWRLTDSRRFGAVLIRALSAENENLKNIAGILIVRAGKKAEPLLQDALHRRENLPMTLSLLADLGDRMVEKEIQPFSTDQDPKVAEAARQALRVLASNR
jgi:hypothetical protein